jgi:alpha-galactosidase
MLAAPLMAGNDLRIMTPEVLKILTNKDALAIDQDKLGKQAYLYMEHLSKLIYVKELSDGSWSICWHNTGDQSYKQRIDWKHFSFLKGMFEIKDIWKNQVIGTTSKNIELDIESHDVLFLKLTPKK